MVKPITKETLFMNVMELDFPSKIELEHWLETFQDRISVSYTHLTLPTSG